MNVENTIPTLKVPLDLQGKIVASKVGHEAGRVPRG